jgi:hypothetical protein
MKIVTALAVVIGILAGVATWLFVGPLSTTGLQVWAAFIGWASFFSAGGTYVALQKSIAGNVWGVVWGTVAFILVTVLGAAPPFLVGLIVCVTAVVMVLGAYLPMLDVIPAHFYGYASVAGLIILKSASPLDFHFVSGPSIAIIVSIVIGNLFGIASGKIATALSDYTLAVRANMAINPSSRHSTPKLHH